MALPHFCDKNCPNPCPKKEGGDSGKGKQPEEKKSSWWNKPNPKKPPEEEQEQNNSPSTLAKKFNIKQNAKHLKADPTGQPGRHRHIQDNHGVHFSGPYERDVAINATIEAIMKSARGRAKRDANGEIFRIMMNSKASRKEVMQKLNELRSKHDRTFRPQGEEGSSGGTEKKKEGKPKFSNGQRVNYRGKEVEILHYVGQGMYVVQHFNMLGRAAGVGRYHESDLG